MKLIINRTDGRVEVLILKHKETGFFSFINLTKGHICPCQFNSLQEALNDLNAQPNVIDWLEDRGDSD